MTDKRKRYLKKYRLSHKKEIQKYRLINHEKIVQVQKIWYYAHKEHCSKKMKEWYKFHKNEIKQKVKQYAKLHKKERNLYLNNRRKIDINFKISMYLRKRMYEVLRGNPKLSTTMKLINCSIEKLKQHLAKKFYNRKDGLIMAFENYGLWHIDHIKPCCTFNLSKKSEQKKCFNYKNLRPLWAKDNLSRPKRGE